MEIIFARCSTTMRSAVHGKEALDQGMESDPERTIFFVHKRGYSARNGLSDAHDEGRAVDTISPATWWTNRSANLQESVGQKCF